MCSSNGLSLYYLSKITEYYDIVFHTPKTHAFRLFRINNCSEAEIKFLYFQEKIIPFVNAAIAKNMAINQNWLQSALDTLNNKPAWTAAHLAAFFNFYNLLECEYMLQYLDIADCNAGMTPLLVAISHKNLQSVEVLVKRNCSRYHKDLQGNTVFHHAANTTPDIISLLAKDVTSSIMNCCNKFGYTPIHLVYLSENYDCLTALLIAGCDPNVSVDSKIKDYKCSSNMLSTYIQDHPSFLRGRSIKLGGTPLHWVNTVDEINSLVDHNCNVDVQNFEKKTALHLMVENKDFDCIITLLSRGADVNIQDYNGNTPLHLAVQSPENIHILHVLIVFHADLNMLNNNGESPRHLLGRTGDLKAFYCLHAVGAKRCGPNTPHCNEYCYAYGHENGVAPSDGNKPTNVNVVGNMLDVACMDLIASKQRSGVLRKGRLLSLDGGGIRGLILIQMLLELETEIGGPINLCFDWITGTSTGGILALGLASGKTAKECLGLYFHLKDQIFPGMRPYPSKPLERMLQQILGRDTYIQDIHSPKLIIPCCLADHQPIELFLYRNYKSPEELLTNKQIGEHTLLWHVARATSAAPTYFRPFNNLIDGGLIANNPTIDALTEIHSYNKALIATNREDEQNPVSIVVSLGTGLVPTKDTIQLPEYLPDALKVLIEAPGILSMLIDQATASDGRLVERANAWCSSLGIPYFRFNPQLSEEVGLNEKCNYKLCRILWETKVYMHTNLQKIKEVANLLKE
ncbi:hypothetical protein Trydic_g16917 [Trypoxylus dichotomus]